jgi:hypothetical protein
MAMQVADLAVLENNVAAKALARYEKLVDQFELGEEVAERTAVDVLRDAGKSAADVKAELDRRLRVAELRRIIAEAGDLVAEQERLIEADAAIKRELDDTVKRLSQERVRIDKEITAVNSRRSTIDDAKRELARIAPPPADELQRAQARKELTAQIVRMEATLRGRVDPDETRKALARIDAKVAEIEKQARELGPMSAVNMDKHNDFKWELRQLAKKRNELEVRLNEDSTYKHQFRQLEKLRAKRAELTEPIANQP